MHWLKRIIKINIKKNEITFINARNLIFEIDQGGKVSDTKIGGNIQILRKEYQLTMKPISLVNQQQQQ